MLVTFVIDTSASMNQTTSSGMTLLDYAKSAVERFVKRVRDPARRYQHHFMLVSCGPDNASAQRRQRQGTASAASISASGLGPSAASSSSAATTTCPPWNGRVRVGWDQSTNKDAFLAELKNLRATDVSDLGGALKQAFELMNQIRLQFNWDNYGLGRTPYNTNVAVCVLLTDATTLSTADGLIQDALVIPPSTAVGADLTLEPFRWDQRLFTVALKLAATAPSASGGARAPVPTCPTDLMALSEATGGMLYLPTTKSTVEQSIDQIITKLKAGAVVKFRCDGDDNDGEFPTTRNIISPIPSGKEYTWPIAEAFWLDRNTVSLQPREAHPTLVYRRVVEGAIEAATNHMLLDTLKFASDSYVLETTLSPSPPRGQRWPVYVVNSRGDGRLGDPIGFLRAAPSGGPSPSAVLVLLPYNYPLLFSLLVEAARVYQASGQSINTSAAAWVFQAKAMPSAWRESFQAYLAGVPLYYYAPLKKALRKFNLQDMVPEVQDSGRSYQISSFLNRLREQSVAEGENNNKLNARPNRNEWGGSNRNVPEASPSASPLPSKSDFSSNASLDPMLDTIGSMSLEDLLQVHLNGAESLFSRHGHSSNRSFHRRTFQQAVRDPSSLQFGPSARVSEQDDKHQQPIDSMSDYESRLIKKEALRNPLGDPEPDEDTPAGLRRRQLCFNLGNPYKKNAAKQQVSNVYQGEAADEAAALGGQSPKRQRTRKRSSQLKRDKKQAKRSHRPPNSPSFTSSPGSPSRSPTSGSSGSSASSSPVRSESGDSIISDASVDSNYSVKAETAQLLGVPLREQDHAETTSNNSFVRLIYSVLAENWEDWSNVLRLIKSRSTTPQENEFIVNALSGMKGGNGVVQTYIKQAIRQASEFKKVGLVKQLECLLDPACNATTSSTEKAASKQLPSDQIVNSDGTSVVIR